MISAKSLSRHEVLEGFDLCVSVSCISLYLVHLRQGCFRGCPSVTAGFLDLTAPVGKVVIVAAISSADALTLISTPADSVQLLVGCSSGYRRRFSTAASTSARLADSFRLSRQFPL